MEAERRIAVALSRRPREPTTIHQLSKLVGKSYSFTYGAVQAMVQQGMIRLQTIGHASLCTLVLGDARVQALLALSEPTRQQGCSLHIALIKIDTKQMILCAARDAAMVHKQFPKHKVLFEEEARTWVAQLDFSTLEIKHNAAYFWAVVGDTHA